MDLKETHKYVVEIPQAKELSYPIFIGEKVLKDAGKIIKEYTQSSKLLLVTNDTVFPIYGNMVTEVLKEAGFNVKTVVIPDGEDYKNINWYKVILDKAIEFKLERLDSIVALGGGVIGDMAGFAAASCLRGISLVQIATTLLAQVDSSVGGKVGINHFQGKNLIGAFYQPKCVIIDTKTLETIDKRQLRNGFAEVIKYAFIEKSCNCAENDGKFFDYLNNNYENIRVLEPEAIRHIVRYSCSLKAAVVQQDEREAGLRAILNFGHTTGHALEVCGNYKEVLHGEGVAIGMVVALNLAKEMGLIEQTVVEKGVEFIKKVKLPYQIPSSMSVEDIMAAMKLDKKVQKGDIRFVLPVKELGKVEIFRNIEEEKLIKALKASY